MKKASKTSCPTFGYAHEKWVVLTGLYDFYPWQLGMSIITNFRKIERSCCQPFQVCLKRTCENGKVSPMKEITGVTNYSIYKARENQKETRSTDQSRVRSVNSNSL